jgi:hypothetical protein
LLSGTLPAGANINSNGTITGTAPVDGSSTTYSFTIQASDGQLQDSTRAFSLTINTDVLSFSLANNTVYALDGGVAMSNVALSATSSANSNSAVTFAANTLPTGVSLSGNTIFGTPTVEETVYTAITATATQTGRTATRFVSWVVQLADAFWKYNTLLIPGASTTFVDDASTNNFAVSIFGNTRPNNANPYELGYYSNYFDGTGDYLTAPFSASTVEWFNADYTIEMWTYVITPKVSTINALPLQIAYGTPTSDATYWAFGTNVAGNVYFYYYNGGLVTNAVSSITVTANAWNHIAMVYTNSTGIMKGYINGIEAFSVAKSGTPQAPSGSTLNIGGAQATYYTGYISNLRIVKGTAVYTSNFTPSTTPLTAITNTSLLTCQAGRFKDNSSNNFTITRTGDVSVQGFDPFVPNSSYSTYGSAYFDGTGDYLSSTSNAAFAFGTGNFTIEAWVSVINYTGTCAVFDTRTAGAPDTGVLFYITGSGMLSFYTNAPVVTATTALLVNTWNHVAVTRSGTTVNLWLNGVSVGSGTVSTNFSQQNGFIGSAYAGSGNMMIGYISDLRVVKGTAIYTAAFTPPTAPLTAIANTSLLTLQNNQPVNNNLFLDNSTNNFLIDRYGNATQGTFSPYGGNWSNFFDGTGDYLSLADNANLNPGTQDFVMEAWVYLTGTTGNNQGINGKGTPSTDGYTLFVTDALVLSFIWNGTGGTTITGGTLGLNTWNHVAVVRNSNVIRLYLNGVGAVSSTACTTDITSTATKFVGQARGGNPILGYMSNYRMTKGSLPSGYDATSASLTPPIAPLTAISGTSLLTCQSNRIVDTSINNFAITKNGDVSVQRFSPFNPSSVTPTSYSGYFDGTGDYLQVASNALMYGPAFTLEGWFYYTAAGITDTILCSSTPGNGGIAIAYQSSTAWGLASSGVAYRLTTTTLPTVNAWNHIVVGRASTGTNQTSIWLNGTRVANGTVTDTFAVTSLFYIGWDTVTANKYFTGYISQFRFVRSDVYGVSNTSITVPTTPLTAIANTSLLTLQSPTFIDNSTNNFTISAFGNSQPTQQNPFGFTSATTEGYTVSTIGGSGYFDGTGDYLDAGAKPAYAFGTGSWTVEAWVYVTTLQEILLFDTRSGASTAGIGCNIWSDGKLYYSGSSNNLLTSTAITANTWNHVAWVYNGTTLTGYINGVSGGTATPSFNITQNNGIIGRVGFAASGYMLGYISDLRVIKGTALYKSNFVPPAQTLTAVQNTVLLTNMTSAGIYDAAMMNNMETVGDAKLSTSISKFGGTSMSFNGSTDWLSVPNITNLRFGTGDFTVELWAYWNSPVAEGGFVGGTNQGSMDFSYTGSTLRIGRIDLSWDSIFSSWTPTANVWYHIAFTRNNGIARAFVDGVQIGSNSGNTNTYTPVGPLLVGKSSGNDRRLNGYIDDLRITKGYARYTANFSPPAGSFKIK